MKALLKKIVPKSILNVGHLFYAWFGAMRYRHPSEKLFVIGVTGTSGKSTTVFLLRQFLEAAGYVVGSLSTIDFSIAGKNRLNDQKMTMLGKMQIQKYLREMVESRCQIAIIETTSEGRVQHRHRWIAYDAMVLTNLYPEHIESHGSFKKYKQAKLDIFYNAARYRAGRKNAETIGFPNLKKKNSTSLQKMCFVNGDIAEAEEFLSAGSFDARYVFGTRKTSDLSIGYFQLSNIQTEKNGISFLIQNKRFETPLFGRHNAMNMTAAVAVAETVGVSASLLQKKAKILEQIPGRIEFIAESRPFGFDVIVDYAFEPKAMEALYGVVLQREPKRIIHVFGSTGGGRDKARRQILGAYIGERANLCIITDEDPYDENPLDIINTVFEAVRQTGKQEGKSVWKIFDRRDAIEEAVGLAAPGDLVLITGKGSEQAMCVAHGKKIPWDDRAIVRQALEKRKKLCHEHQK